MVLSSNGVAGPLQPNPYPPLSASVSPFVIVVVVVVGDAGAHGYSRNP